MEMIGIIVIVLMTVAGVLAFVSDIHDISVKTKSL